MNRQAEETLCAAVPACSKKIERPSGKVSIKAMCNQSRTIRQRLFFIEFAFELVVEETVRVNKNQIKIIAKMPAMQ